MARKIFTILENNPDVMNQLAAELGLGPGLSFYDVYSLTEPELLAHIPRPAHALLVTIPMTPSWHAMREAEDGAVEDYAGSGAAEPVLWFKQTIDDACGSIGLIHCALNGAPLAHVAPGSELARIREAALPLTTMDRARVLEESAALEAAHQAAAALGQTPEPPKGSHALGNHFVAFVKGSDGHLWELEGVRKGPLDRGALGEDEDVLCEKALDAGLRRVMEIGKGDKGGDLRFSCIVLAPTASKLGV